MSRTAVVLINLGGPVTQQDVEPFLARLFSDVIRLPWGNWGSKTLGNMVARRRAAYSRGMYRQIGGGSPILAETEAQTAALQRELGDSYYVSCAMRYSSPTIRQARASLANDFEDWDRVIALPLFPQYSFATTRTCQREWHAAGEYGNPKTVFIGSYHDHPDYIAALRDVLSTSLEGQESSADIHVVFSAHGVPTSYIRKGDIYQTQIEETTQKVMAGLPNPFSIAYQSRVGPVKWLQPNTLKWLPKICKHLIQCFSLGNVAGKAIQNITIFGIIMGQPFTNKSNHNFIRYQCTGIHCRFSLFTKLRSGSNRGT